MKILQELCLLFAGALASIIGGFVLNQQKDLPLILVALVGLLLLLGVLPFSRIENAFLTWRRKGVLCVPMRIGILHDMGWDETRPYRQYATGTSVTCNQWKIQIEDEARKNGVKVAVRFINTNTKFHSYALILNPYGGVYPENNLTGLTTLDKIFDYVDKGGMFVNVADVPGFWAYSPSLERKTVAVPPITYVKEGPDGIPTVVSLNLVAFTPFVKKLGLIVNPHEKTEQLVWKNPQIYGTERLAEEIKDMRVDRVAVVERNVDPIMALGNSEAGINIELTPFFLAAYGNGRFLISLVWQDSDQHPNNIRMKDALTVVLVRTLRRH